MARATTDQKTRAPQGAKRVAQAFLDELATIAGDKQVEVGIAAQWMVRETLMARRDKAKAAKQKLRAKGRTRDRPTRREGRAQETHGDTRSEGTPAAAKRIAPARIR